jgi:hypothetical protein
MSRRNPGGSDRPSVEQISRPVDEGMAMARHICFAVNCDLLPVGPSFIVRVLTLYIVAVGVSLALLWQIF